MAYKGKQIMEVKQAIRELIDCKNHLIFKWEGEYGNSYPTDVRNSRITELKKEIAELQEEYLCN
jgi:hypothetical protein